jgi:uncharacterized LabA/DUF88 family protein
MADQSYLFVDGAYLRQRHSDMMSRVFGVDAVLHLSGLRNRLRSKLQEYQRVFYYDCLHDIPHVGESEADLTARIQEQKVLFDDIQSLHGFHVRLGSLSGSSRKLRLKEVDILLAVEMLDHAFRKNMSSAALVAGDLDFAPLIDSLVRLGTWVDVLYDPRSIASGLLASADRGVQLTFDDYYALCTAEYQNANRVPQKQPNATWRPENEGFSLRRTGHMPTGETVQLFERETGCVFFVDHPPSSWLLLHDNRTVLENYFTIVHSSIEWQEDTEHDPT